MSTFKWLLCGVSIGLIVGDWRSGISTLNDRPLWLFLVSWYLVAIEPVEPWVATWRRLSK